MSDTTISPDKRGRIARYIEALQSAGADPSAEEIADALWLLQYIDPGDRALGAFPPQPELEPQAPPAMPKPQSGDTHEPPAETDSRLDTSAGQRQASPSHDLLPAVAADDAGRSGALLKTRQASALPGAIEISRALRALRRRVPSRTVQVIDEQATAQRTAEERVLSIVVRPARSRWLAIDLVIDESASMAVWQRTALAFRRLLTRLGAFRDVRVWGLNADSPDDLRLYAGPPSGKRTEPPHSLNELIDPSGRHLILIVSDCVSPGWHSGALARAIAGWQGGADTLTLAGWGRTNPVAIVHMLPQQLWRRTSLGREARVRVYGSLPGVPNALLHTVFDDSMFDEDDDYPPGLAMPVMALEPQLMGRWAGVLVGKAGISLPGYILNPTGRALPPVSPIRRLAPSQLVQNFIDRASPEAQELAILLAAVPITISVINLVQQQLPNSRQVHAAEVLLSGLLYQVTRSDQIENPEEIAYEFVDGVRELLLEIAVQVRPAEVIERLSAFVADHLRGEEEMQARVAGAGGPAVAGGGAQRPFARLSAELLRRLGLHVDSETGQVRPLPQNAPAPAEVPTQKSPRKRQPAKKQAARPATPGTKNRLIYDAHNTQNLPGTLVRSEGQPPTGDIMVDEAYDSLGAFYDFFWEVFKRDSLDGVGLPLEATVHFGESYNNAFWNGERLVLGDGDGKLFNRLTLSLDQMSHELSHGIVQKEARLTYYAQPGALNESICEVFGALVKQYRLRQTADLADWLIGAGLLASGVNGVALRSMKAPGTAYDDPALNGKDPQPAHMRDFVRTFQDNGGVHINSGILNHAFYLVATRIGGYAWEKAGRIWYEALHDSKLRPNSGFRTFARLTIAQAGKLFGQASFEQQAVRDAWSAVGVDIADKGAAVGPSSQEGQPARSERLPQEMVREQFRAKGLEAIYSELNDSERSLLQIPYFLAYTLDHITTRLGSSSEAITAFFKELNFTDDTLDRMATAAFDAYSEHHSYRFDVAPFADLVGQRTYDRLVNEGALIPISQAEAQIDDQPIAEQAQFAHPLMHDYLAARFLSQREDEWTPPGLDVVSFESNSFDALSMTLELLDDEAQSDMFIERVYNWNWAAAPICIAKAMRSGSGRHSQEIQFAVLALLAEEMFDPVQQMRKRANEILSLFPQGIAAPYRGVRNLRELNALVQQQVQVIAKYEDRKPWFPHWRDLFVRFDSPVFGEQDLKQILNPQAIIGWTAANVLRRFKRSDLDVSRLRAYYDGSSASNPVDWQAGTIRSRVVHALGATDTHMAVDLLFEAFNQDSYLWSRIGAARSLVEIAALTADAELRRLVVSRLIALVEGVDGQTLASRILRQIGQSAFYSNAHVGWEQAITPLIQLVRDRQQEPERTWWSTLLAEFLDFSRNSVGSTIEEL